MNTGAARASYTYRRGPMEGTTHERLTRYGIPGMPDIIGWQKGTGKFIGVECKVGSNKRTQLQEQFAQSMLDDNCIYILAYDLKDVESIL